MMKRAFIFVLAVALFIAITGGYGQLVNSRWITRSFISAEERPSEYPEFVIGNNYKFYENGNLVQGRIVEANGRWLTVYDQIYYKYINLDRVTYIEIIQYKAD
ncbi:MAG: hypothetical protein GX130_08870 [Candidatus Hydrogenedens sp.]|nr:hypothetical protein [Candidatus Hydrogenedens sp.]